MKNDTKSPGKVGMNKGTGEKLIFQLNLNSLPRLSCFAARLRAFSKLEKDGKFELKKHWIYLKISYDINLFLD